MEEIQKEETKEEIMSRLKGMLTEQGVKVSGNGLIIAKLDALNKKQDRTNQLLSFIEKKIEQAIDNQLRKIEKKVERNI